MQGTTACYDWLVINVQMYMLQAAKMKKKTKI